ncbi:MAG: hypothetical protein HC814_04970 [Rhodobacteraceae bacterium]|nr:hypothetical protein [Paracoccaceae bacterium]
MHIEGRAARLDLCGIGPPLRIAFFGKVAAPFFKPFEGAPAALCRSAGGNHRDKRCQRKIPVISG